MRRMARFIGRSALAAIFVRSGARTLMDPAGQAARAQKELPFLPEPELVARGQAGVQLAAGIALSLGVCTRLSAAALAATMFPVTYVGHPFWSVEDPAQRQQQLTHFFKNVGLFGGLLLIAVDAS